MNNSLKQWIRGGLVMILLLTVSLAGFAEGQSEKAGPGLAPAGNAKYVFVFIGDGVGMPQISAAEAYLQETQSDKVGQKKLSFSQFPAQGLTTTYAEDRFITGSAASATAIACGEKTTINTIAMNGSRTKNLKSLSEIAKDAGMKVGIVSSVDIDHATPASFYAHAPVRSQYYEIGLQLADSPFDYFGGGRVRVSKTPEGKKTVLEIMEEKGWNIVNNTYDFNRLRSGDSKVYAYNYGFASDALKYQLDSDSEDITLAEFTKKGIELLDNPDGFFMMVEGGKIDWACHANDGVAAIYDTLAFDNAVREAINFYNKHPQETLIVVAGDHECGGLTLGFAGTKYSSAFKVLDGQKVSYEYFNNYILKPYKEQNSGKSAGKMADLLPILEENFGLTNLSDYETELLQKAFQRSMMDSKERSNNEETYLTYGGYEPLTVSITHILNRRAGMAWTSYSHTGVPVPIFALGVGADGFNGYYDNTDVFHKTVAAMGMFARVANK